MERLLWALALIAVSCSGNSGGGKTDPCEDQTCSDHGECLVNSEGQPVCDCDPGYDDVALTCVANCFAVDCGGLGGCIVVDDAPHCVCDQGYEGVGLDCRPAPEACGQVSCSGRGGFVEIDAEPACICETGYAPLGLGCVPASCTNVTCSGHGACVLRDGAPSCECDPGYMAVGLGCVSDECRADACSGRGACALVEGEMQCTCDHGYVAVDDECRPAPCELEDCSGHGACVDGNDGPACRCDPGYVAEGLSCRPACGDLNCDGHGACVQQDGEARCVCDPGYVSLGQSCRPAMAVSDSGSEADAEDSSLTDTGSLDAGATDEAGDSGDSGCERPGAPGEWVLIPAGTFTMGSPDTELGRGADEVEHEVTLTRSFWMMEMEITQGQFEGKMEYNPSSFSSCGLDCPVEQVNWYEVVAYANALSRTEGLEECYYCTGSGAAVTCEQDGRFFGADASIYDCAGYRLPTEAEWEYAARGGTTTATYNGDLTTTDCTLSSILGPIGWYCGNASGRTHPVGEKLANGYGLHDMLGNVWEWCHDWNAAYPGGAETDPTAPPSGSARVLRGGSWVDYARGARAADRHDSSPGTRIRYRGARFVRSCP